MVDRPAAITSGGLFYLNVKSPENALQTIDGRWTVEVKRGSRVVVARCDDLPSYKEALGESLSVAQQGLDLLAVRGVTTLAIANADREHLVWWVDDGCITLRVCGRSRI